MELYGGIDLHSNNCVVVILNNTGQKIFQQRLNNSIALILETLAPFHEQLQGLVVESTYNWYWLVDALIEADFHVHLANTAAIQQYSGLKHADDNSDARWLAEMLRLDIVPTGYIYPKEQRMARDLMRKRMQLVQQRTLNLLAIQGLYSRHFGSKITNNAIKKLTAEQVNKDFSDFNVSLAVNSNLAVMQCLKQQILTIEKQLKKDHQLSPEFCRLTSIDGIGNTLALTIMLETGDIHRFKTVGDFSSYCRCIGGARYSNGKKKGNTNSKNGNKYLAWAFVEAANFSIRYNTTVKRYYQKKLAKTNNAIAIKTVAHKLARACFYVLRDQVEFDVNKAFGQ
jgi:transposase